MVVLELILLIYCVYVVSYTLVFSFAGRFHKIQELPFDPPHYRFCVLIPAYKEDKVILETARKALNQSYPAEFYEVIVIADSLHHGTVARLRELPIRVVEVSFENSTKVKSLNRALEQLEGYDYAVILDADNVMALDYLEKMNAIFLSKGYTAVQGQRKPKNEETTLAFLDGISESINNHIYRQGSSSLNLSSSINGSGIAFEFKILKEKLATMTSVGGFDRELELLLLDDEIKVRYFRQAVVFDEKVSQSRAFENQRKRWISSQYFYLRKYFISGVKALFSGNFTYFNSAVLRNIQLPRLLNIGLLFLLMTTMLFLQPYLYFNYYLWPSLFIINALAIFIAIPSRYYSFRLLSSLASLPGLFTSMASLMFRIKGANEKFLHTPHGIKSLKNAE